MRGNGMTATIGRLRECALLDWKFVVLSHNTIRGAAGAAVLNAEVLARTGKLDKLGVPLNGASAGEKAKALDRLKAAAVTA
jgi:aspartate-semialdehyde dehydrogenase